MKRYHALAVALLLILTALPFARPVLAGAPDPAARLLAAEAAHEKIPLVSNLVPDLDAAGAMVIQKQYVQNRLDKDPVAGFKAGLTHPKAQQRFGLASPVAGVLFRSGRLENHAVVGGSAYHSPVIETEIGFVLSRRFDRKIEGIEQLTAGIREVLPVIELPDLGFVDMKVLRGTDIIAANVSSRKYVVGDAVPMGQLTEQTDVNTLDVVLYRDGEPVNRGRGSDAMTDQWQALLWLANTMIGQGYALEPGQILITGALGKMVPGKAGHYRAEYGVLGTVWFDIR